MNEVLSASAEDEDAGPDPEDTVNEAPREADGGGATALQSVEQILIFLYVKTHKTFVIVGI
jgi:hypothetical protein